MNHIQKTAAFLLTALTVSSCAPTTNPYTGQTQTSKTTQGALLGTLGGAAIGALIGDKKGGHRTGRYALRGALMGAAAGAGIGQYMDQQEALIRRQLEGSGVSVSRVGNDLVLNMPSDITFQTGRAEIQPQFANTLASVALILMKYQKTNISIVGHTDSDGGAAYNQRLSMERARSVAHFLNRQGVSFRRMFTDGRGESSPVASNSTAAGKALNRRVELRIIPQQNQF